jgi:sulfonate transport system substrate-binding protein
MYPAGRGGRRQGAARLDHRRGEADGGLLLRTAGHAPEGYKVEYSNFQSGQLVLDAMNGGSLDYGGLREIPPIFAAASSAQNFRQVAIYHGDVNN